MTHNVDDMVMYGSQGICKIVEISEQDLFGDTSEYYVLKPLYDEKSTVFIPTQSESLTAKMKKILSQEEIYSLIKEMPDEDDIWIENETQRREKYKEILSTGDRFDLVRLIRDLYLRKQTQKLKGKKLHLSDERFMNEAEKMICEEFSHVLQINKAEVIPFIFDTIPMAE